MRMILAVLAVIGCLFVVRANAEDWKQHKVWQDEFVAAKAKADTPEAIAALADLPHCTRAGNEWIGAWQLQRAAWSAHTDDDRAIAEKYAEKVIDNPNALPEAKAKARTIIGHGLTSDGKLKEALAEYTSALALYPSLKSAQDGKALVEKALASKG